MSSTLKAIPLVERYFLKRRMNVSVKPYPLVTTLVENPSTRSALETALTDPHVGVHVFWAPNGAGKSTYLRSVIPRLHIDKRITGAGYFRGSAGNPTEWLQDALGIASAKPSVVERFASLLGDVEFGTAPYILAIDQFDELVTQPHIADLENLIVQLATASLGSKSFAVVLGISDIDLAKEVLTWNGGEKIRLVGDPATFKWNEEQVVSLASKLADKQIAGQGMMSDAHVAVCCVAGTPGTIIDVHTNQKMLDYYKKHAQLLHATWTRADELNK